MKRIISRILVSALLPLSAGVAVTAAAPSAEAQVVYTVGYPPASYIASYRPVYYNGYAHYWYNNHWYYHDHGVWRGYATEPGFLYGQRGAWGGHYYHWR